MQAAGFSSSLCTMVHDNLQHVRPCQSLWEADSLHLYLLGAEVLARKVDTESRGWGGGLALRNHTPHPEVWARDSQMDTEGTEKDSEAEGQQKEPQVCRDPTEGPLGRGEISGSTNWYGSLRKKDDSVDKRI